MSKVPIRSLLYAGSTTKVFAALMGWFGKSGHISVGYNSQSATQVQKQVEDMQSRGIDGAIIAWYGKNSYENKTTLQLMAQAEAHPSFQFAIMIDRGTLQWDSLGLPPTDALIAHLNYIADTYYSSPAYTKVNGRPIILEFALESYNIDWVRVRSSIRGNPMIIFRNPNGWTKTLSDGAYSWEPEKTEMSYLDYFYTQAMKYPLLQTMGSLSPSFNDSLATWSENRYADAQCGQLWLKKAAEANKYWSPSKQIPFMQIATWNDYEEGTTIESGVDNCLSVDAQASESSVSWSLNGIGQENTIDHYTVFVSQDGMNLMPVADLPVGSRIYDLNEAELASGSYQVFVKAVGKPSLLNHMSNGVQVAVGKSTPSTTPTSDTSAPGDYSLQVPTADVTLSAAQPASITVNAVASNGFNGTITFSCSTLPSWARCSFTPSTAQVGNGATSTTLIITAVRSASLAPTNLAVGLLLVSTLIAVGSTGRKSRRLCAAFSIVAVSFTLGACGGSSQQSTSTTPQMQSTQPSTTGKVIVTTTASDPAIPPRTIELNVTLR